MLNSKRCRLLLCVISLAVSTGASPPAPPKIIDPNSDEFLREAAKEKSTALEQATTSGSDVIRNFNVGRDIHYGYFLNPADSTDKTILPDFLDPRIVDIFNAQYTNDTLAAHAGHRLICECVGVEWEYYGMPQFAVRSAKLSWMK